MTYEDYIQQVDAAWTAAQARGDVEEALVLAAILYRLVQPPEAAIRYLRTLVQNTNDAEVRSRYGQAIADIQQCRDEAPPTILTETEEKADGPITAEHLARLACTLYQQTAPQHGLPDSTPWEVWPEAQQQCAIAVARRLLHRIEAHARYAAHTVKESEATDALR